ncbi:MAG: replication-associated recombination protein A [Bradymonadia bacterium]|jgi:putative ATPase
MDLFDHARAQDPGAKKHLPLAEAVRPDALEAVLGQERLLGPGRPLRRAIESDRVPNLVLWGPPGTGKTTIARVLAARTGHHFEAFSAVLGGVKELRLAVEAARERLKFERRRTILFVDEIHRFNKGQQDALLPHVEDGTVTLIGATTENPSFELNAALLSRARVVVLQPLPPESVRDLLRQALEHPVVHQRWPNARVEPAVLDHLAALAGGDARRALSALEAALDHVAPGEPVDLAAAQAALDRRVLAYDKAGDQHYEVISAFIKSLRGTDPDAAVYWMMRMIEAGEDPMFVLRRLVVFASEDIGLADPGAVGRVMAAVDAFRFLGLPEGLFHLVQATVDLACAPKSNTVLRALAAARGAVSAHGTLPVPLHLRNATTGLQTQLGYGDGYKYPHEFEGNYTVQQHLPEGLEGQRLFEPGRSGAEEALSERLRALRSGPPPERRTGAPSKSEILAALPERLGPKPRPPRPA